MNFRESLFGVSEYPTWRRMAYLSRQGGLRNTTFQQKLIPFQKERNTQVLAFGPASSRLKNYIEFFWAMTEREFKARYKRAVFGFLWVILNPLLQMIIVGVIFSFFIKIPNYFLFLFTGFLPWSFFSLSLSKATTSFVSERLLLKKSAFAKEVIPESIVFSNFLHYIVSLGIFIVPLLAMGLLEISKFPQLLFANLWLLIFTLGICLFTATMQVRFRDTNFFTQTILTLWFYTTPILYSLDLIPSRLHFLFAINPLTSIFEIFHCSLVNKCTAGSQPLFFNATITIVVLVLGLYVFRKNEKFFVDWL